MLEIPDSIVRQWKISHTQSKAHNIELPILKKLDYSVWLIRHGFATNNGPKQTRLGRSA